jgi:thioredoxin reductase (NADPH)
VIELADLRNLPVFAGVDDAALNRAAARAADVRVDEGQWLVREGEAGAFYVLLSGSYELVKRYGDGIHELARRDAPGEYLGELPIIFGTPFFAGARALTPLRVARFDRLAFGQLIRASAGLRAEIARTVQERVEGLEDQALSSITMPVVLGGQHDPACHGIRDFLSRNQVVYEWADPDDAWIASARPELGPAIEACANGVVVHFSDGRLLRQPTLGELARAVGLQTAPSHETYDVVIVGGGPAGLASAVYGASEGLRTLLVEREATGGQAGTSSRIENYLGFPSGVSGDDLASRAREQALRLGAEIVVTRSIERIFCADDCHTVTLDGGVEVGARALILATGVQYRTLQAEGLDSCIGIGVFYGASRNEAAAMQGRDVILVGGGNSAGQAAMFFADYARSVTILVRGAGLASSMSRYLIDELGRKGNVQVRGGGEIVRFGGDGRLDHVTIRNREDGSLDDVHVDGVFIFIGAEAITDWLPEQLVRDERGFVCTGRDVLDLMPDSWPLERDPYLLETSVPGVFAAGDVRHGSIKRVASSVGEGSIAIAFVHEHLADVASRASAQAPAR